MGGLAGGWIRAVLRQAMRAEEGKGRGEKSEVVVVVGEGA
jgi:hypothetical protein